MTASRDIDKKTRWIPRMVILGFVLTVATVIVLDCSGLIFTVNTTVTKLSGDFSSVTGVAFPSSTVLLNATRLATRDPTFHYEMTMSPADLKTFISALGTVSSSKSSVTIDSGIPAQFKIYAKVPNWWHPEAFPDARAVRVNYDKNGVAEAYCFFYSPSTGRIFMYWFST